MQALQTNLPFILKSFSIITANQMQFFSEQLGLITILHNIIVSKLIIIDDISVYKNRFQSDPMNLIKFLNRNDRMSFPLISFFSVYSILIG